MNSKREHPQERPALRRRFAAGAWAGLRHAAGWLLRSFIALLILLSLLFAYLHLVGLPAYFTDMFLDRLAARGFFLQIERLTLEIDRGLVAWNVRLYADRDAPDAFLKADALTVAANPLAWLGRRPIVPVVSIVNGALQARLGRGRSGTRAGSRDIAVDHIHLRFAAAQHAVILREFSADFLDIHFAGRGTVYPAEQARPTSAPPLAAAMAAIENAPDWVLNLVNQAHQVDFAETPDAEFTFTLHPDRPEKDTIAFRLKNPAGGGVRGVTYDHLDLDVAWQDRQIRLAGLKILREGHALDLSGRFEVSNQVTFAHLINTLPPDTFFDLLPPGLQEKAGAIVADYHFPFRLDVQLGPAPLASLAKHVAGRLTLSRATIRDVPVEHLDAVFAREGAEVRVDRATVQLGVGPGSSRLDLTNGMFNLATLRYEVRAAGTFNPHVLKPVMTPGMRNIVEWFDIRDPLAGNVVLGGVATNPAIYCFGPVAASNFAINRVEVQSLQARLDITNEVMHITGATLARPEGVARGDAHMDFHNQIVQVDVDSRLDPRAIAGMLGPGIAAFMEPFRLHVPTRLQVAGTIDYGYLALNRFEAHVAAQPFGYDRWLADSAVFDCSVRGRRLLFTNVVAAAYGGQFSGHGWLYPVGSDTNWRYEATLNVTNANLAGLLAATFAQPAATTNGTPPEPGATRDAPGTQLSGTLDGQAWIGGYIGAGTGARVVGTGRVAVRHGILFQTRLFKDLSDILNKIIPDFNLLDQTAATGNFTLRNGRLVSRDIELQGALFSIKAAGDYAFNGELDYRVEVQLLRGGPIARIVRLATLPVTRLLEFRLTGTFENPRWRPLNLNPADLFSDSTEK